MFLIYEQNSKRNSSSRFVLGFSNLSEFPSFSVRSTQLRRQTDRHHSVCAADSTGVTRVIVSLIVLSTLHGHCQPTGDWSNGVDRIHTQCDMISLEEEYFQPSAALWLHKQLT